MDFKAFFRFVESQQAIAWMESSLILQGVYRLFIILKLLSTTSSPQLDTILFMFNTMSQNGSRLFFLFFLFWFSSKAFLSCKSFSIISIKMMQIWCESIVNDILIIQHLHTCCKSVWNNNICIIQLEMCIFLLMINWCFSFPHYTCFWKVTMFICRYGHDALATGCSLNTVFYP